MTVLKKYIQLEWFWHDGIRGTDEVSMSCDLYCRDGKTNTDMSESPCVT
jgi:hypothetical protein